MSEAPSQSGPLNAVLREFRDWKQPTLMLVGNHDQARRTSDILVTHVLPLSQHMRSGAVLHAQRGTRQRWLCMQAGMSSACGPRAGDDRRPAAQPDAPG